MIERKNGLQRNFRLQWHLTNECSYNCSHCYMKEDSYRSEIENGLSIDQCMMVVDNFVASVAQMSESLGVEISPVIHLTGGDPMLYRSFWDVLRYIEGKAKVGILGNPEEVVFGTGNAPYLKKHGVCSYQISIDGNEDHHDYMRKGGSFKRSLLAIKNLDNNGIKSHVMYNVTAQNMNQLIPTIDLMIDKKANMFSFARVCSIGNGKSLNNHIDPMDYRQLLLDVYYRYKDRALGYNNAGRCTKISLKDPFFSLLLHELGELDISDNSNIYGGCEMGISFMAMMADGKVHACRRMQSYVGDATKESFYDIFMRNEGMSQYRDFRKYEKCSNCELLNYCRGCPAVSSGATGKWNGIDPQCWK